MTDNALDGIVVLELGGFSAEEVASLADGGVVAW
jgi:hypothetical protein